MIAGIIAAADAAGKNVHKSKFVPPIINAGIENGYVAQILQIARLMAEFQMLSEGIRKVQDVLNRIGGDIGEITSVDSRFLAQDRKIFMKIRAIHSLSLVMDEIYRKAGTKCDLVEISKILNDEMRRIFLIAIDLSGFKRINDTWGHETGDFVLNQIVRELLENERIKSYLEQNNLVCMPFTAGGDEFLISVKVSQSIFSESIINRLMSLIREIIRNNGEIKKRLLFNEDTRKEANAVGISIPENFEYRFLIGIGFGCLHEAFYLNLLDPKSSAGEKKLARAGRIEDIYLFRISSIISMLLDVADNNSHQDKNEVRKNLFIKGDPHSIAQAKMIDSRGESVQEELLVAKKKIEGFERRDELARKTLVGLLSLLDGCNFSGKDEAVKRLKFVIDGLG